MFDRRTADNDYHDEGYFVSMTDMMIGFLFIFILIMMVFALQLSAREEGAQTALKTLLESIQADLKNAGIAVEINTTGDGIIIPEAGLFTSGRATLSPKAQQIVSEIRVVLENNLECYVGEFSLECTDKNPNKDKLQKITVEGHTDKNPYFAYRVAGRKCDPYGNSRGSADCNWELSASRAITIYRELVASSSVLNKLASPKGEPIFSVAGYGATRPLPVTDENQSSTEQDEKNRRIELRYEMYIPPVGKP